MGEYTPTNPDIAESSKEQKYQYGLSILKIINRIICIPVSRDGAMATATIGVKNRINYPPPIMAVPNI